MRKALKEYPLEIGIAMYVVIGLLASGVDYE
jgi:hypothetical protein